MLCSGSELGLAEDKSGIMELADDAPAVDLAQWLDLDDTVIDVDLTPDRADCLSIRGLARDLSALHDLPLTPQMTGHEAAAVDVTIADVQAVELDPRSACARFTGRIVRDVNMQATVPTAITERLRRADVRSISPGVDVTNYIMLELGQPMLFEAALFLPAELIGKPRRYGCHTESSHRFERGVDPEGQREALEAATALLISVTGGHAGPVTEVVLDDRLPQRPTVILRSARLARILGVAVPDADVARILSRSLPSSDCLRIAAIKKSSRIALLMAQSRPCCAPILMRTSLISGLIDSWQRNASRQQESVRLFETGLRFLPVIADEHLNPDHGDDIQIDDSVRQQSLVAGLIQSVSQLL